MTAVDLRVPAATERPLDRVRAWAGRHALALLVTVAALLYFANEMRRWITFRPAGYDLGLMDQMVTNYARFRPPYAPIAGHDFNMLGDHFSPMNALFAPLYWIWADPRMLLGAQAVLIAVSAIPVYRFAARRLGSDRLAFWITLGYAFGWPLQAVVSFDVHDIAFAVPLIAFAIDALDRRADRSLILACLALVLVKEDMGLVVITLGMVRAWTIRPRRTGFVLIAIGVVGYLVATALVIPSLSASGGVTHWIYTELGPDLPSSVVAMLTHPLHTIGLFFWSPPVKSATLFVLGLPVLFLCVRSPYVLVAIPLLAERFFADLSMVWSPYFHYSGTVWPVLALAAVDAAAKLRARGHLQMPRLLAVSTAGFALIGTVVAGVLYPLHDLAVPSQWRTSGAIADRQAVVEAIPASTCVEVDDFLVPRLTHSNLTSDPGKLGHDPDFVALDLSKRKSGTNSPKTKVVRDDVVRRGYELVMQRGKIVLYRSPTYAGPSAACKP